MNAPLLLGVDGGGTSTTAWLADPAGLVLGRGRGGPSNAKAVGGEAAKSSLDEAIGAAFADATLDPRPVAVACLGLAGFDRPEDRDWLLRWASGEVWPGKLVLVNDGDLVVAAGTPEGWGVGVIAGTGSIAVGRAADGRTARAGGWGHLLGDEGSAYAVALAGLRKVARRADGREPIASPGLTRRLLEILGIETELGLVSAVYNRKMDRARLASLAPAVVDAAMDGDDPSILEEILEPAGRQLAEMVDAVARDLDFPKVKLPLAVAGSFLLNCPAVAGAMVGRLLELGTSVMVSLVREPVEGAVILARREWSSR